MFSEIEVRREELDQVVIASEQCLEGPINEAIIQDFIEHEDIAQQQVEATPANIKYFEAKIPR
jgi:hypothetical protein